MWSLKPWRQSSLPTLLEGPVGTTSSFVVPLGSKEKRVGRSCEVGVGAVGPGFFLRTHQRLQSSLQRVRMCARSHVPRGPVPACILSEVASMALREGGCLAQAPEPADGGQGN